MAEKLPAYATPDQIPAVVNNLTSDSTTSALSAAQGKALNSKLLNVGITFVGTNSSSTVTVGNDTGVEISTLTLDAGIYIIVGCADWASSGTGYRQLAFADGINPSRNYAATTMGIGGKEVYQQVIRHISLNSQTTISLYARQTSGNNLNVYPFLFAIKLQ